MSQVDFYQSNNSIIITSCVELFNHKSVLLIIIINFFDAMIVLTLSMYDDNNTV